MNMPSKRIQDTKSWSQAQTAKSAWKTAHKANAPEKTKRAAADAYKAAMRQCYQEMGLVPGVRSRQAKK